MMKQYAMLICFVLSNVPLVIQAQNIDNYLKTAAKNNPKLKASYTAFEAAMQKIPQAGSLPEPALSFGYFISPIETRTGSQKARLSLSQMFPWFGTLAAKEEVVTYLAEAKYQEFIEAKNELFFKVKSTCYSLYEIHEQIRWQQENLKILNTLNTLATTSFANGKGAITDVIRVDIMTGNTTTDIELLKDQLQPLEITFHNLLNDSSDLHEVVIDSMNIIPIMSNYRKDSLLAKNPKLQMIDKQILSAVSGEELIKKQGFPGLSIGIDYIIVRKRSDVNIPDNGRNAFMPTISISIPILRGRYKAARKEAQLTQTALKLRREDMENRLLSSYEMAIYKIEKAGKLHDLYNVQIVKTQQAIDLLHKAYSNSGLAFEEVLRMHQQLLKYKMAKATTIKNFHIALAELDYLTAKSE